MKPSNLLFIMSDQHSRKVAGCYGNPFVKTPVLDRLAAAGTLFENAYSPSPICVPARAALATGRQVHETRCWDNASPYTGLEAPSWGHRLQARGIRVESIGKLHYRNEQDDTGFERQIIPLHVVNGIGDVMGSVRDPMPVRRKARDLVNKIGAGESGYTRYDRQIADHACKWLLGEGAKGPKPWMLFVSFVAPHPPWFAPQDCFDRYEGISLPMPKPLPADAAQDHPWLEARRASHVVDPHFTDDTRRLAIRSYYALTSFLDDNVGRVLAALRQAGLEGNTRVIYTSDHGEDLGSRAMWGKGTLTEESGGIPLIVAGPDVPRGRRIAAATSLLDVFPSVLDCCGVVPADEDRDLPGKSLFGMAAAADDPQRPLMTQYHASGAATGAFMLRRGSMKYLHYVGFRPQLYDLACDPEELQDLAPDPSCREMLNRLERELRSMVDPDAVDARAKADQLALVERHGGRDAVVKKGGFGSTPAPGETPEYR